jgi:hypothetical protein
VLVRVFYACAAVYNWLIDNGDLDWEELDEAVLREVESMNVEAEQLNQFSRSELLGGAECKMARIRDRIAKAMWRDYCAVLVERGEV